MILTPFGIDRSLFWDPSLESFDIPNSNSSSGIILVSSGFLFFFPILFLDYVSWNWSLHSEAGNKDQSAQRKRSGPMMCSEATWKFVCFLPWFCFSIIPYFIEILRTKFLLRWVECNIPNLNYCIFLFSPSIYFELTSIFI